MKTKVPVIGSAMSMTPPGSLLWVAQNFLLKVKVSRANVDLPYAGILCNVYTHSENHIVATFL